MTSLIPSTFDPNDPIPNPPFNSTFTNALYSIAGPLVIGAGISVDYLTGYISASGGGGGGGTVTCIGTGPGIVGGPITASGTIALATLPGPFVGGSFTNSNITVDAYGRVTAATSGSAGGVTSVNVTAPVTNSGTALAPNIGLATVNANPPTAYTYACVCVDCFGRVLAAQSGTAPVTSVSGSAPISSTGGTTPTISLNTLFGGSNSYTAANITVDQYGRVSAASNGNVGVTSVAVTAPIALAAGSTAAVPNICLNDVAGLTAGSYTYTALTVDAKGRVTLASSGAAPNTTVTAPITNSGTAVAPVIGISDATAAAKGAVQAGTNIAISSGVISVSDACYTLPGDSLSQKGVSALNATTTQTVKGQALDACVGNLLQTQINALTGAGALTLAGTFDADLAVLDFVSNDGQTSTPVFTQGSDLPAPAVGINDYFVIVTTGTVGANTYTPPGGTPISNVSQGDWFVVSQTSPGVYEWVYLNTGYDAPVASDTNAGIVELATTAETQTGTDATRALTPAGAAATYVPLSKYATCGDILVATSASNPVALPVAGTADGYVLTICVACNATGGITWKAITQCQGTVTCITPGTGLTTGVGDPAITTTGNIALKALSPDPTGSYTYSCVTVDCFGRVTCASNGTTPITVNDFNAKGDLLVGTANDAFTQLAIPVASDGCVLITCNSCSGGLTWVTPTATPNATPVTPGILRGCTNNAQNNTFLGAWNSVGAVTGTNNTALGTFAGANLTTGGYNSLVSAGNSLSTGSNNVMIGNGAGDSTTTGSSNVYIGAFAAAISNISENVVIGRCASLWSTASGGGPLGHVIVGTRAGLCNCAVGALTLIGFEAGRCIDNPVSPLGGASISGVTAVGVCALATGSGPDNTAVGTFAGLCMTSTGKSNTLIGSRAGCNNTSGCENTFVGVLSGAGGPATGNSNTALGFSSLLSVTSGTANVSVGHNAGACLTTGSSNAFFGPGAGRLATAISCSTAIGANALGCGSGGCTVAVGAGAGANDTQGLNTYVGYQAGATNIGSCTTAIGSLAGGAGGSASGADNTSVGHRAGNNLSTGSQNVLIGNLSGNLNTSGSENTFVGAYAASSCAVTGTCNTSLGWRSLTCIQGGAANVAIGAASACRLSSGSNNAIVGVGAANCLTTGSFNAILGSAAAACGVTTACNVVVGYAAGFNDTRGCNTYVGYEAGRGLVLACNITAVGFQAGGASFVACATPGTDNTSLGYRAGYNLTTGNFNVALGSQAGCAIATSSRSVAVGAFAGASSATAATGNDNISVGHCSGASLTSGCENVFVGTCSGRAVTVGRANTATGLNAGAALTGNSFNTLYGWNAGPSVVCLGSLTDGINNTAIGASSSFSLTTGQNNTTVGNSSGAFMTTGSFNTLLGSAAGCRISSGLCNVAIGFEAGRGLTVSCSSIAIGSQALGCAGSSITADGIVAIGSGALGCVTTGGSQSVAIGFRAGTFLTTGGNLTAIGYEAGLCAGTSFSNTLLGLCAGRLVCGSNNTAIGVLAGCALTTGSFNVLVGENAGRELAAGGHNTLLGTNAGRALTSSNNVFVGSVAGCSATTGDFNILVGCKAGWGLQTGFQNVMIGSNVGGQFNANGQANVMIGHNVAFNSAACYNVIVGHNGGAGLTSGNSNTFIGQNAGSNVTTGGNNIVIGVNSTASSGFVNNEATIGAAGYSYRIYAASWGNASDARDKTNIENLPLGLEFLKDLRPVRYNWDWRDENAVNRGAPDIGFIAQEVLEAQENADADYADLVSQANPDQLMIHQTKLIPILVNAIKELAAEVEALKAQLNK